jgi:hypothetical protein
MAKIGVTRPFNSAAAARGQLLTVAVLDASVQLGRSG